MHKIASVVVLTTGLFAQSAAAWDGFEYESGSDVEIERGNLVRIGSDIELYDYRTGKYHSATVESINPSGGSVEVEVYDHETGEYRTLEMDGR